LSIFGDLSISINSILKLLLSILVLILSSCRISSHRGGGCDNGLECGVKLGDGCLLFGLGGSLISNNLGSLRNKHLNLGDLSGDLGCGVGDSGELLKLLVECSEGAGGSLDPLAVLLDKDKKPLSFSVVDKLVFLIDLFLLSELTGDGDVVVIFSPSNFNHSDHGDNLCNFGLGLHSFGATLVNESSQLLKFSGLLSNGSLHRLNIEGSLLAISGFSVQLCLKSPHFVGQLLFHSYLGSDGWVHKILLGLSNLILMSTHGNRASLKSGLLCRDVVLELSSLLSN
jgi:hypothetical protein